MPDIQINGLLGDIFSAPTFSSAAEDVAVAYAPEPLWMPEWTPQEGPQIKALESEAQEVLYGGGAGGGKTNLLIGASITRHERSIIFRRELTQLTEIELEIDDLLIDGVAGGLIQTNRNKHRWLWHERMPDGGRGPAKTRATRKFLELGAVQRTDDWMRYKGRAHDFIGFDELTEFERVQFTSLIIWNRTTTPGQRCRVIATTNPPTEPQHAWVLPEWGPWIDKRSGIKAAPGEILYYLYAPGETGHLRWYYPHEVEPYEGGYCVSATLQERLNEGEDPEMVSSRTFIPALVDDNVFLRGSGYKERLSSLPDGLRNAYLYGDFSAFSIESVNQVFPPDWIEKAFKRYENARAAGKVDEFDEPDVIGIDPARGGTDRTTIARRRGQYLLGFDVFKGADTPDGGSVAALALRYRSARMVVDVNTIGGSVYDALEAAGCAVEGFLAQGRSEARDKSGFFGFNNARSEAYWKLREALDPTGEAPIGMRRSNALADELLAHTWKAHVQGIQVESKDKVKEAIGRSPDLADAAVMAFRDPLSIFFD